MFGLSGGEILTLILMAFILMGPKNLPENMRKFARFIKKVRAFATNATISLKQELGPEFADLNPADLNPKNYLKNQLLNELDLTEDLSDLKLTKNADTIKSTESKVDPDLL